MFIGVENIIIQHIFIHVVHIELKVKMFVYILKIHLK